MVSRQIKKGQWEHVYRQITTYGRSAPLSLQYDVEVNCNGVDYILKVQPGNNRAIFALQALGVYPNGMGGKDYSLIEGASMLAALLDIIVYQGAGKR